MGMYRRRRRATKKPLMLWICSAVVLLAAVSAGAFFWLNHRPLPKPAAEAVANKTETPKTAVQPKPPLVNLQPVVDAWVAKRPGINFGIVVYDPANKQVVASHNADEKFFAASLYKLYIAYLALVDFQDGKQDPNQSMINGFTRKQCVDKMIRESYSPCGEAMMADMGQETLRQRVAAMGINNTVFAGITTTAQDAALILQYIVDGRDLNADSTAFLKDAMRVQDAKFRGGLAKGSPDATWETKVGWNESANYHDVGIMTLPSGRVYVVAILTQNNGSPTPIADFSATIYAALK